MFQCGVCFRIYFFFLFETDFLTSCSLVFPCSLVFLLSTIIDYYRALEDQKKLPGMIRAGIHMLSKWRAKVIKDSNEEGGDECHCQACGRAIEDEEEKDDVLKHLSNMEAKYELNLKKLDQEQLRSAEEDLSTFRQIKGETKYTIIGHTTHKLYTNYFLVICCVMITMN